MTPQLQQAIKLLALSSVEIEAYINEAVEKNPLLETASPETGGAENAVEAPGGSDGDTPTPTSERGADELLGSNDIAGNALDVDYNSESFPSG